MTRAHSLRWRLTSVLLLIFVLGLGASALFSYVEAYGTLKELHKRTLQGQASELLARLRVTADGHVTIALPPEWEKAYRQRDGTGSTFAYTLYDAAGRPIALSPNLDAPLPLLNTFGRGNLGRVQVIGPDDRAVLAVAAPDGYSLVVLRKQADREALAESLIAENSEHLFVLVPFILASLPLIWQISMWSLRPLARVSREAAAVGPDNPNARLSIDGLPDEIRPLVDAVNGALARLAGAYEGVRRLTADAAHELRTPIAVLDLRLQKARLDGHLDWPTLIREMAQLRRLVDQLLVLARKENALPTAAAERQLINLSRTVREAAAVVLPLADDLGREIEVDLPDDPVVVQGQADDLRDMLRNLIDNGLIHGMGTVRVSLRRSEGETAMSLGRIVVEVGDQGAGVPETLREAVFDRFHKANPASQGAGLGLSIVREVVRAHSGEISLVQTPDGFCVRIVLPAADNKRNGGADPKAVQCRSNLKSSYAHS